MCCSIYCKWRLKIMSIFGIGFEIGCYRLLFVASLSRTLRSTSSWSNASGGSWPMLNQRASAASSPPCGRTLSGSVRAVNITLTVRPRGSLPSRDATCAIRNAIPVIPVSSSNSRAAVCSMSRSVMSKNPPGKAQQSL